MNFKKIAVSLILIAILGIVISSTLSITGFTTTGIDTVDFQSSDSILNGPVWTINIVQGGLSQSVFGSMAPNYQDTEGGAEKTEKGFSLDITHSDQQLEYPIIIDYGTEQISKVEYFTESTIWYEIAHTRTACLDYAGEYGNIISVYKMPYSTKNVCVYKVPYTSSIGTFNNKILTFSTDFEMKIGDRTYTNTISTKQDGSDGIQDIVKFTDNTYGDVGYVKWLGNLVSGQALTTPAGQYRAAYFNNQWNIISDDAFDDYKNNYVSNIKYGALLSESDLEREIIKNNNLAVEAMSLKTFKLLSGESTTTEGMEGSGKVVATLDSPLQYPTFVAYVSADSVKGIGVYQPVAAPKLLSVSDIIFKTGEIGYTNIRIQNIGDERGGFSTSVSCSNQVTMVGPPKYNSLESGESISITIPITGQTTTQSTCTATTSVLGLSDSKTFNAVVSAQQICTPYAQICLDGVSSSCKSDGSGWKTDGDDERCIAQEEDKGSVIDDTFLDGLFGEDGTSALNNILVVVLIIIFAVIGLLMFYGIIKAVILAKVT